MIGNMRTFKIKCKIDIVKSNGARPMNIEWAVGETDACLYLEKYLKTTSVSYWFH